MHANLWMLILEIEMERERELGFGKERDKAIASNLELTLVSNGE